MNPLVEAFLEIAAREVGVREVGRNRGQRVEEYLASVGLPPGNPWCASFVYWAVHKAALQVGRSCPLPHTGSVHRMWRMQPRWYRVPQPAPGALFFHDSGAGLGHMGFVEHVQGDELVTVEGNTEDDGSRDGDGVYRRIRQPGYVNLGYLDLGMHPPNKLIVA